MELKGHSVNIFALNYSNNLKTEYSELFPNPVGDSATCSYTKSKSKPSRKVYGFEITFFRKDVSNALKKFLKKDNFDRAIVLQFWGKLSPSIFRY